MSRMDTIDLDSGFYRKIGETPEARKAPTATPEDGLGPIPDGDFELVLLGEDPTKGVKIESTCPNYPRNN